MPEGPEHTPVREPDTAPIRKKTEAIIAGFSAEQREEKKSKILEASTRVGVRGVPLTATTRAILELKLARHLQNHDSIDANVLADALKETPKFLEVEKGSLHRALEVHEQKTLIKIAEMRRRRAEITDDDEEKGELNPWENIYETKSGEYYLARLLNMPHLEEESEYMDHCVGLSDSYISAMKRGEVEIFSFRRNSKVVENIDEDSAIMEETLDDNINPLVTIEYDVKDKTIVQIKKSGDDLLTGKELYFGELFEALGALRGTRTDREELRDFDTINPEEFEQLRVGPNRALTNIGVFNFEDPTLLQSEHLFTMGDIEGKPTVEFRRGIAHLLKLKGHGDIPPETIAVTPTDPVLKTAKVYVGELTPEVLRSSVEGVFDLDLAEFPYETLTLSVPDSLGQYPVKELEKRGVPVAQSAKSVFATRDYLSAPKVNRVRVAVLTLRAMGYEYQPRYEQIPAYAASIGLELLPLQAVPALSDKVRRPFFAATEGIRVGTKDEFGNEKEPRRFYFFRKYDDPDQALRAREVDKFDEFPVGLELAFMVVPKTKKKTK